MIKKISKKIFQKYFWKRRTLGKLSEEFELNRKVIQALIHDYEVKSKIAKPREIGLIIDVVFFSKRKFKTEFGIMVFYDAIEKEVIYWEEVKNEKLVDYQRIYFKLKAKGFTFKYVVIDGKKGLRSFLSKKR